MSATELSLSTTKLQVSKNRHPVIIDLDSIISDFQKLALKLLKEHVDPNITLEQWTSKRLDQCMGPLADQCIRAAMSEWDFWQDLEPIDGATKALVDYIFKYQVYIVTQRHARLKELTHSWLCAYEVPFDQVLLVEDKEDKLYIARQIGALGIVDDDPDTCRMFAAEDYVVGQLAWPWNKQEPGIIRMNDWPSLGYAVDLKLQDKIR